MKISFFALTVLVTLGSVQAQAETKRYRSDNGRWYVLERGHFIDLPTPDKRTPEQIKRDERTLAEEKTKRRALILSRSDDEALPHCDFSIRYKTDQYNDRVEMYQDSKSLVDDHNKEMQRRYGRLISDTRSFLNSLTEDERKLLKEEGHIRGVIPFKEKERAKIIEGLEARFEAFNNKILANNFICPKGAVQSDQFGYCEILTKKSGKSPLIQKFKAKETAIEAYARLERAAPDRYPQGLNEIHTTLHFYSAPNLDRHVMPEEVNEFVVKISTPAEEEAQIQEQLEGIFLKMNTPPPPTLTQFLQDEVHPVCFNPDRPHVVQGDRSSGKNVPENDQDAKSPKVKVRKQ